MKGTKRVKEREKIKKKKEMDREGKKEVCSTMVLLVEAQMGRLVVTAPREQTWSQLLPLPLPLSHTHTHTNTHSRNQDISICPSLHPLW